MRTIFIALSVVLAATLSACNASNVAQPSTTASPSAVSKVDAYATSVASAKGFPVGNIMAARTVYVYFDTQCPHCGHLWEALKPLNAKVKFIWVPVALLNKSSLSQGAALLSANDPVAAMNDHESQMSVNKLGMSAVVPTDAQRIVLETNNKALMQIGAESVPYMVAKDPILPEINKQVGGYSTEQLRLLLGMQK